jgi:hypothetical protein
VTFETVTTPMTGSITCELLDPAGVRPPSTIIRATDPWAVRVKWEIAGDQARFIGPNETWNVRVFLESMGPGPENQQNLPTLQVLATGGTPQNYDHMITIPANTDLANPAFSGVYKLVVVLTLRDAANNPLPVAGFHEGPVVQFYLP